MMLVASSHRSCENLPNTTRLATLQMVYFIEIWARGGLGDCASARGGYGGRRWARGRPGRASALGGAICCVAALRGAKRVVLGTFSQLQ